MANTIAIFRETITYFLPLLALHFYIKYFYQILSWELLAWWVRNFSNTEHSPGLPVLFSFLFIGLFFFISFTSLLNAAYLGFLGEKQSLVYLGNSEQSTSHYYDYKDQQRGTFLGINPDQGYNTSFNDIFTLHHFVKDPGSKSVVGIKTNRLQLPSLLASIAFFIAICVVFSAAVHAVTYPVYQALPGNSAVMYGDTMEAFKMLLHKNNLGIVTLSIIGIGAFIAGLVFATVLKPDEKAAQQVESLPFNIRKGNQVVGIPVEQTIIYRKTKDGHGNTQKMDIGDRFVSYAFDDGFPVTVYVALKYNTREFPSLEGTVESHIRARKPMPLKITADLNLLPSQTP